MSIITGTSSSDLIIAGNGNDTIDAGAGSDIVVGGNGNDTIYGGSGSDIVSGGNGNDNLYGGSGNDILSGGNGNDYLVGGAGSDIVSGENGNDTFVIVWSEQTSSFDLVSGGSGTDTLILNLTNIEYLALKSQIDAFKSGQTFILQSLSQDALVIVDSVEKLQINIVGTPPTNNPPVAVSDNLSTSEDQAFTFNPSVLLANDTDPDNDTLTITAVNNGVNGLVTMVGGQIQFTPTANYNGSASFNYTVSDGHGGTAQGLVNVAISEVNDAPVAVDDSLSSVAEDSGVRSISMSSLVSNDSAGPANESGQSLSITSVSNAVGGSVMISGSNILFTLNANYFGPASFDYTVADNGTTNGSPASLSDSGHVSFNVTSVNDAPVAHNDVASTTEDSSVAIAATTNDTDVDVGDSRSIVSVGSSLYGAAVTFTSSLINYNPLSAATLQSLAQGQSIIDSFAYTMQDSGGLQSSALVSVTVNGVNDVPINSALIGSQSVSEDSGFSLSVASYFNDVDNGDVLTYSTNSLPSWLSFDGLNFSGTPLNADVGSYSIQVTATDSLGASVSQAFNLTVNNTNDAPVAHNDSASVTEDSGITSINVLANDTDEDVGDSLSVLSASSSSTNGAAITFNSSSVSYDASSFQYLAAGQSLMDSFSYTIKDASGAQSSATVNVEVTGLNDAPINAAMIGDQSVNEDSGFSLSVASYFSDIDNGDVLTYSTNSLPSWLSFDGLNITGTPLNADVGSYSIEVSATDILGASVSQSFNLTVNNTNDAPVAVADNLSTSEDHSLIFNSSTLLANDTDPDNDALSITAVSNGLHGVAAILGNGQIQFTPDANYNGASSFNYTVSDGHGGTAQGLVNVAISEVNDAPVAGDDSLSSVAEDSGVRTISMSSLLGNDSAGPANESGQTLSISSVSNAIGGSVSISGSDILFTLDPNYYGPASFDYLVSDNGTTNGAADYLSDSGHVSFSVSEVNDAPTAGDDSLSSVAEDSGARTISMASLLGNDSAGPANESGQTLSISNVSNAIGGSVSISGSDILFTLDPNYYGPASFDYLVSDNGTTNGAADYLSDSGHVSFSVSEVNDAPTAGDDSLSSVNEDSGVRTISMASLLGNDSAGPANESGQTLSISSVSNAIGGSVSISGSDILFSLTPDYVGAASFDYTLSDNGTTNGLSDPLTDIGHVSFDVLSTANQPPVAGDDVLTDVAEDSAIRIIPISSLLGNDSAGPSSESGQTLSLTNVSNAIGGSVSISGSNILFDPDRNYNGPASFDYTITDNGTTNGSPDPLSDTGHVSFNIWEVNDAPGTPGITLGTFQEDSGSIIIPVSQLLDFAFAGPLENTQTVTLTSVSNPIGGTVSISGSNVIFNLTPDFDTQARFNFTITDNGTTHGVPDPLSATATAVLNVSAINDAPVAGDDVLSDIAEDSGPLVISIASLLANDSVGPAKESSQILSLTSISNVFGGTASISGSNINFSFAPNFNGPVSFDYTITDNGTTSGSPDPQSDVGHVSFAVWEVNDRPSSPSLTVANVQEDAGTIIIPMSQLLVFAVAGPSSNESAQTLTVTGVSNPVGGTVSISGSNVIFNLTPDFDTQARFNFTITDNGTTHGVPDPMSTTTTAAINVSPVNDAPVAGDDVLSNIAEDSGPRIIPIASLLANDSAGPVQESSQTISLTAISNVIGGTASISGSNINFSFAPNYNGPASFDYTITDNGTTNGSPNPLSDTGHVSFNVTPVADPPVNTVPGAQTTTEDSSGLSIAGVSVSDPDDISLTTTLSVPNAAGRIQVAAGGSQSGLDTNQVTIAGTIAQINAALAGLKYIPNANFNGTTALTVQTSDGVSTDSDNISINVTPVNDAPVNTVPVGLITGMNAPLTFTGLSVSDPDGGSISVLMTSNQGLINLGNSLYVAPVANLNALFASGLTFTPNSNFSGNATITVTTNDLANGGSPALIDTDTFTIFVDPSRPALFTAGNDNVVFDNISSANYWPGTQYDALAGDDRVLLPSNSTQASEAGYALSTTFHGGAGNDVLIGSGLNDVMNGDAGNNIFDGGQGVDLVIYDASGPLSASLYSFTLGTVSYQSPSDFGPTTHGAVNILHTYGEVQYTDSIIHESFNPQSEVEILQFGNTLYEVSFGTNNQDFFSLASSSGLNHIWAGFGGADAVDYGGISGVSVPVDLHVGSSGFIEVSRSGFTDVLMDVQLFIGGPGNDLLSSGNVAIGLYGGAGDDRIHGGSANQEFAGQDGTDTMVYDQTLTAAHYQFSTSSSVNYNNVMITSQTEGIDTIATFTIGTSIGSDLYEFAGTTYQAFYGSSGNDQLSTNIADGVVYNPSMNHLFLGLEGLDTVDYSKYGSLSSITMNTGSSGYLEATRDGFKDILVGVEQIIGGSGDDTLQNRNISGTVSGGDGNDTVIADEGNDSIYGGAGTDKFKFSAAFGTATVNDFSHADGEKLDLSVLAITNANAMSALTDGNIINGEFVHNGIGDGDAQITFSAGHIITLLGVDTLVQSDFL